MIYEYLIYHCRIRNILKARFKNILKGKDGGSITDEAAEKMAYEAAQQNAFYAWQPAIQDQKASWMRVGEDTSGIVVSTMTKLFIIPETGLRNTCTSVIVSEGATRDKTLLTRRSLSLALPRTMLRLSTVSLPDIVNG
eukprot:GHVU01032407.1.p1 GENE.GHVU01032407.1~~GHVU01032407.1.p1  ORF type:complete len:138 (-),score=10.35 GHVU01032407.1:282-695(-)